MEIILQHRGIINLIINIVFLLGLGIVIAQYGNKKPYNGIAICYLFALTFAILLSTITIDFNNWWNDLTVYAIQFTTGEDYNISATREPLFYALNSFIRFFTDNYKIYFFIIAILYTCSYIWACKNLTHNKGTLVLYIMVITSLFFVAYGSNTIRAGLAMSLLILGISFYPKNKIIFGVLALCAINIHLSMLLTLSSFIFAIFINKPKACLTIWLSSIILSLGLGSWFEGIFMSVFDDKRTEIYLLADPTKSFYKVGFHWDFVIYSILPIIIGYYYIYKKQYRDKFYSILYCTYLIANSFWVLVIRANYTDRFAYLSWALMPIILMYPLINENNLYNRQNNMIASMLLFNIAITFSLSLL